MRGLGLTGRLPREQVSSAGEEESSLAWCRDSEEAEGLRPAARGADDGVGTAAFHLSTPYEGISSVPGAAQVREHDLDLAAMGLGPIDLAGLEARFEEEEVWAAIKALPSNKSHGPDAGFPWDFYKCCWPVVKADVLDALQAVFLGRDQGFGGLNSAFLTLLPKLDGAVEVKDFRPISLVHSFGKLVAKMLATRLAPRMSELIHTNQSAFIKRQCIQDNFVLL
ncbi:hypothetical protein QYE76_068358 [Lolium multiflorum]|uniref:Reverse transcriptase domain-containing protein n=1 Tax=Lolium multiflorum TaxID=4521 RepID=A0AAD8WBV8_LOLMU|nr:hypothetical protein QYE76_068358 [Lolium multiflorum]